MEETIKRIKKELVEDQYTDFWWGKDIRMLIDYIENESIPKEKVRDNIEVLEYLREDALEDGYMEDARIMKEKILALQKLLGE